MFNKIFSLHSKTLMGEYFVITYSYGRIVGLIPSSAFNMVMVEKTHTESSILVVFNRAPHSRMVGLFDRFDSCFHLIKLVHHNFKSCVRKYHRWFWVLSRLSPIELVKRNCQEKIIFFGI